MFGGLTVLREPAPAGTQDAAADAMSGAPCAGEHAPREEEGVLTGAMRKAQEADAISPDGASAADAAAAPAAGDAEEVKAAETKWVEMPAEHVRWILAQRRENHPTPSIEDYELYRTHDPVKSTVFSQRNIDAKRELFAGLLDSLRASHGEFFEYQARVRDEFGRDGRVLVPEEALGPRDGWQEDIDAIWAKCREEYAREHPADSDGEDDESAMDADCNAEECVPLPSC